jgi:hypothetical protein
MGESIEYAMVESRLQLNYFSNFENDFTEPSVPTCLPTYVDEGWVKGFMSKT